MSDAVDFLQIRNLKVAARKRVVYRKEIEETIARKRAEGPHKKKNHVICVWHCNVVLWW